MIQVWARVSTEERVKEMNMPSSFWKLPPILFGWLIYLYLNIFKWNYHVTYSYVIIQI